MEYKGKRKENPGLSMCKTFLIKLSGSSSLP
jgi:hypothetical protein